MPTSVESEGSFPLRFREMVYGVLGSNRTTQSRPSGEIVSSLVTNVKNSLDEFLHLQLARFPLRRTATMSPPDTRFLCYIEKVGRSCQTPPAPWCNWLTRRPLKAESSGSIPDGATIKSITYISLKNENGLGGYKRDIDSLVKLVQTSALLWDAHPISCFRVMGCKLLRQHPAPQT
jgi:hypothetical protein